MKRHLDETGDIKSDMDNKPPKRPKTHNSFLNRCDPALIRHIASWLHPHRIPTMLRLCKHANESIKQPEFWPINRPVPYFAIRLPKLLNFIPPTCFGPDAKISNLTITIGSSSIVNTEDVAKFFATLTEPGKLHLKFHVNYAWDIMYVLKPKVLDLQHAGGYLKSPPPGSVPIDCEECIISPYTNLHWLQPTKRVVLQGYSDKDWTTKSILILKSALYHLNRRAAGKIQVHCRTPIGAHHLHDLKRSMCNLAIETDYPISQGLQILEFIREHIHSRVHDFDKLKIGGFHWKDPKVKEMLVSYVGALCQFH